MQEIKCYCIKCIYHRGKKFINECKHSSPKLDFLTKEKLFQCLSYWAWEGERKKKGGDE